MNDLEKLLEELKGEAQENKAKLDQATFVNKNSSADATALEKVVAEVQKLVDAYAKNYKSNFDQKNDRKNYYTKKKPMLETAVPELERDRIDRITKSIDEAIIPNLKKDIENKEKAVKTARVQLEDTRRALDAKAQNFDAYKNHQKRIEDNLKNLKSLRDTIEAKETEGEFSVMYFHLTDFGKIVTATENLLITKDRFENDLSAAWLEFHAANKDFREKEKALNDAQAALKALQEELSKAEASRTDNILAQIKEAEA